MLDRRLLFAQTVDDLKTRLSNLDSYQLLGCAALLRKILMDEASLLDLVNKSYKKQFRFTMVPARGPRQNLPSLEAWAALDAILPEHEPQFGHLKHFTKKQFLSHPVLLAKNHKVSVADVISFNAHVTGAVHAQEPHYEKDKAIVEISNRFGAVVGGQLSDLTLRQLRPIGRIVESALDELLTAVLDDLGATRAA